MATGKAMTLTGCQKSSLPGYLMRGIHIAGIFSVASDLFDFTASPLLLLKPLLLLVNITGYYR